MKGNLKNNYLLAACVLVLSVLCFMSVRSPMRFEKEKAARELDVKRRLVSIRGAEEKYKALHAVYCGSLDSLVKAGLLPDSLKYIPHSDGKEFVLTATTVIGKSGKQIPLMECSAGYEEYLKGLDANAVSALVEEALASDRFPGLKIGDIAEPNDNAGNW